MKKSMCVFLFLLLLAGCSSDTKSAVPQSTATPHQISPGSAFDPGGCISFENLDILYNGDTFSITSNREDIVCISVMVVGTKSDGSYDIIQWPAFSGKDEAQYQIDLEENGWAIAQTTNMVRPGETLIATLSIFDFGEDFPAPDIDNDGYYEIVFSIHQQESDGTIKVSADAPVSPVYKLKAE